MSGCVGGRFFGPPSHGAGPGRRAMKGAMAEGLLLLSQFLKYSGIIIHKYYNFQFIIGHVSIYVREAPRQWGQLADPAWGLAPRSAGYSCPRDGQTQQL
jgi:hypothetical protein